MPRSAMLPLLLTLACDEEDGQEFDYVLSHDAFELGDVARTDFEFPTASVSLLNLRNDSLRVTLLAVDGSGSMMVEPASSADFSTIASGASITMEVAVTHDQSRWDSGAFEPALVVQLGRLVDASSDWNDPDQWVHDEI
mgnify:FL=1